MGLIVPKHEMSPDCCALVLFLNLKKKFFSIQFLFLSCYWICYHIASVLCFVFLAMRHMGSYLPEQGLNPHLPHWKAQPQPADCQGRPSPSSFKVCLLFHTWLSSYHCVSPGEPQSTPTPPHILHLTCHAWGIRSHRLLEGEVKRGTNRPWMQTRHLQESSL